MPIAAPAIAVTLGPSCRDETILATFLDAGVTHFRLNLSQDDLDGHAAHVQRLRAVATQRDLAVTVIGDLCGPRLRVGPDVARGTVLQTGDDVMIGGGAQSGTAQAFGTNIPRLAEVVTPGQRILIDEGRLVLSVRRTQDRSLRCEVRRGGPLRAGQGINLPDSDLLEEGPTAEDLRAARWAVTTGLQGLWLSFVRTVDTVATWRRVLAEIGGDSLSLTTKIETRQATENLAALAAASDELVIARGDLGVEVGPARVPALQERIVHAAHAASRPVVLATHVLHSMMDSPEPSRAEVNDVAWARRQGVDTLLLTGETAIGRHPGHVVRALRDLLDALS